MKQIVRLTESDLRNMIMEAITTVQYDLFGEPEVKRIRKTRKDKMTPEQKKAAKEERDAKKKAEKEKAAEEAWAKKGVIQTKLDFNNLDESTNPINESFKHWQSPRLIELIKQHGIPKYNNMSSNYFLTQLRDDNIEGISERSFEDRRNGKNCIQLGDGTYLIFNTNNNEVARGYCGDWSGRFTQKAVQAVRPNNQFAAARDYNHIPSDYYSRQHYKPTTRRGEDARDLRYNPYFINGKDKEYNRESGWNRKEANRVMNNLRSGRDQYGNENKPIK